MFKAQLWIKDEWSLPLTIISINIVPKINTKYSSTCDRGVIEQVNQYHVIYIDRFNELEIEIYNSLSCIKLNF